MSGAKKVGSLTSLRFFAAGLVAYQHAGSSAMFGNGIALFATRQAVSFFFVLSGFILSHAYQSQNVRKDLRTFWVARFARLWPAHIATVLLAFLAVVPFSEVGIAKAAVNALLLQSLVPLAGWYYSVNAVSWSISTEMFFYLAFPFVVPFVKVSPRAALIASVALVVVAISACWALELPPVEASPGATSWGLLYISPFTRFAEFLAGMAAYQIALAGSARWKMMGTRAATGVEGLALVAVIASMTATTRLAELLVDFAPHAGIWFRVAGSYLVFAGMLVVLFAERGAVSAVLRWRPLVYLGEVSFALYLVHQLILRWMFNHHRAWIEANAIEAYVMFWAAAVAASMLIYHLVETPSRRVIRRTLARKDAGCTSSLGIGSSATTVDR